MNATSHHSYSEKICRICVNPTNYLHSIDAQFENVSYATIIQAMCPVKIEKTDNLPKFICFDCEGVLLRAYKLREICMDNDRMLRSRDSRVQPRIIQSTSLPENQIEIKRELNLSIQAVSSTNETVICIDDSEDDEPQIPVDRKIKIEKPTNDEPEVAQEKVAEENMKSSRTHEPNEDESTAEKNAKRPRRNTNFQSVLTKAVKDLSSKKAATETNDDDDSEDEDGRPPPTIVRVFKCDETNCIFSHKDEKMFKMHLLLEHSGMLKQTSQHAVFDVKVKTKNCRSIYKPFGNLCMKDGSQMAFAAAPGTHLFCKLCINDNGRIVHIVDENEDQFLQHLMDNHVDVESKPADDAKEMVRVKKSNHKFTKTRRGKVKIVNNGHQFYQLNNKNGANDFLRYVCSSSAKNGNKCKGQVHVMKDDNQIKVIKKCRI